MKLNYDENVVRGWLEDRDDQCNRVAMTRPRLAEDWLSMNAELAAARRVVGALRRYVTEKYGEPKESPCECGACTALAAYDAVVFGQREAETSKRGT